VSIKFITSTLPFLPLRKAYGLVTGLYGCAFGVFATVARDLLSEETLLEFLLMCHFYTLFSSGSVFIGQWGQTPAAIGLVNGWEILG
jgi:hypothetical protein